MERRTLLGSLGGVALAAVAGCQETDTSNTTATTTATGTKTSEESDEATEAEDDEPEEEAASDSTATAVTYARNVEEVRGHLTSSVSLLQEWRTDDATLHAGHGSDYFAPVLTPLRDEEPELATELRGHLSGLQSEVASSTASEYEAYVTDEVMPLLSDAVEAVVETTLAFRVETAAGVPLPSAQVDGAAEAVRYLRQFEELRGHFASSVALLESGNESAATLHAGHGADYVTALLPAVQRTNASMASELLSTILGVDDYVSDGADAYESHVDDDVLPAVDEIPSVAVPSEYRDSTGVSAAVIVALAGRVEDEYSAAVTDEEVIELYGEYWDVRGFLTRMEARFSGIESDLDSETRESVSSELDTLRTELETAATPDDVADSVETLTELLSEASV